ncbi:MAG: hypothetical protein GXP27_01745 [Planctomycetes bacterium]|nr:hypothetical protein [Planctomycetota bacterium]
MRETADGWSAEMAVPVETVHQSGMDLRRLQLNAMAQSHTPRGLETVFLTDPRYGTKFRSCLGFLRLVPKPAARPRPRRFTVRLHFAEIEDVVPGQRIFDVAIQGKTVAKQLDVIR